MLVLAALSVITPAQASAQSGGRPLAPTLNDVSASVIPGTIQSKRGSLTATWSAPDNTGRPSILHYDLQYKLATATIWTDGPQDVTGTSSEIGNPEGLAEYGDLEDDTEYDVRVRAVNSAGDGAWSTPRSGTTILIGKFFLVSNAASGVRRTEGETAVESVSLNVRPTSNVTVRVVSHDETVATVSPQTLTFTPSNWGSQNVTYTAVDNDVENSGWGTVITHTASGAGFDGRVQSAFVIDDNDSFGFGMEVDAGSSFTIWESYTVEEGCTPAIVTYTESPTTPFPLLTFAPSTLTWTEDSPRRQSLAVTVPWKNFNPAAALWSDLSRSVTLPPGCNQRYLSDYNFSIQAVPYRVRIEPVEAEIRAGGEARFRVVPGYAPEATRVAVEVIGRWGTEENFSATLYGTKYVDIPPGTDGKTVSVSTTTEGGRGWVTATVLPDRGYPVAASPDNEAVVEVTEVSDRPTVRIRAAEDEITEGDEVVWTVTADPPPLSDLPVALRIDAQGDYGVSGHVARLTIPKDRAAVTYTVRTVDDEVGESNGQVSAQLTCQESACEIDFANDLARVKVNDNDGGPVVHVSVDGSVTEGGTVRFRLTTDPPSDGLLPGVDVRFTVRGGDFDARLDPGADQGKIPRGDGSSHRYTLIDGTKEILIYTTNDDVDEPYGQVTLRLLSSLDLTRYRLPRAQGDHFSTANIYDDDGPPPSPSRPWWELEGESRLKVGWDEVAEATGYDVRWGIAAESARDTARVSARVFTTPELSPGVEHAFEVSACNDAGCSEPSPEVRGSVEGASPTPPAADAGPDVEGKRGEEDIALAGSGTAHAGGSQELSYGWRIADASHAELTGLTGFLEDAGRARARFTVPRRRDMQDRKALDDGNWIDFELTVTDGDDEFHADTTRLTVRGTTWTATPPTADAGADVEGQRGERVTLDGSGTSHADGSQTLSYRWRIADASNGPLRGADRFLQGAGSAAAEFSVPERDELDDGSAVDDGNWIDFELTVTDGDDESRADTMRLTINGPAEPTPPTADAGPDLEGEPGERVTLQGTGSTNPHGEWWELEHLWRQTSGPGVTLSDATKGDPWFDVPADAADGTVYGFELTVTDKDGESDTDAMTVTVVVSATPPTADAGPDVEGKRGEEDIALAGSGTTHAGGSQELSYGWRIADASHAELTGLTGFLEDADRARASFTVPRRRDMQDRKALDDGNWIDFELTVTDGDDEFHADAMRLTIRGTTWTATPPTADAGPDLTGEPGERVTLQGTGSTNPHGEWWELEHLWKQTSGPGVTLSDATKGDPWFDVPADAAIGTVYGFELKVTDKDGESDADTMTVTVVAPASSSAASSGKPEFAIPALVEDVTPEAAARALFGEGGLSDDQLETLDRLGNGNGIYDLGDALSWADRCRRGEAKCGATAPLSSPPLGPVAGAAVLPLVAFGWRRAGSRKRRRPGCGSRLRGRIRNATRRARGCLPGLALLCAIASLTWGCGDGRGPAGPVIAEPDPGFLTVELTSETGARAMGALLAVEGTGIGQVRGMSGFEFFQSEGSSRRQIVVAGDLSSGPVADFWVPDRTARSQYRVQLLQVTGEAYEQGDASAFTVVVSR